MAYKTILVEVDESAHLNARVGIAATMAVAHDAHLIGTALTGIARFVEQAVALNPYDPSLTPHLDTLRGRADRALDIFEEHARGIGVKSLERRLVDDEASGGIGLQARYADLAVVGQNDPDDPADRAGTDFPEYVTIASGAPVLIVPHASRLTRVGERVLVAWNGSREARHAVQAALPLLKRADMVAVVTFNPAKKPDLYSEKPDTDIARYLERHGIEVDMRHETARHGDIAVAMLSLAADAYVDLLVMGCYGHSRFREILLGGVTRKILSSMTVPVLMAH